MDVLTGGGGGLGGNVGLSTVGGLSDRPSAAAGSFGSLTADAAAAARTEFSTWGCTGCTLVEDV